MANFYHSSRVHNSRGRKGKYAEKLESRERHDGEDELEHYEVRDRREKKGRHDQREAREMYRERRERENRENRERENREGKENRDRRDNRENRNARDTKDNHAITTFVLGTKELEGKNAEFQYDKGWYTITDIVGEEKSVIYKSKNAQEAYTKWNVYIGRKKERPQRAEKAE